MVLDCDYDFCCCSSKKNVDEEMNKSFGRKAVSFVLITVTGGVALSALDDLAIYQGCSRYIVFFFLLFFLNSSFCFRVP